MSSLFVLWLLLTVPVSPADDGATAPQIVTIDTADFQFTPSEVTVERSRPVLFRVIARISPHAFQIPDLELEQVIFPPETGELLATFDEEGEVLFRCRFHHKQGMVGTVRVVEPGSLLEGAEDKVRGPR
ncbi:MAG: cupredoxin domain-containing protein [Acidobacteriota bacterium]